MDYVEFIWYGLFETVIRQQISHRFIWEQGGIHSYIELFSIPSPGELYSLHIIGQTRDDLSISPLGHYDSRSTEPGLCGREEQKVFICTAAAATAAAAAAATAAADTTAASRPEHTSIEVECTMRWRDGVLSESQRRLSNVQRVRKAAESGSERVECGLYPARQTHWSVRGQRQTGRIQHHTCR